MCLVKLVFLMVLTQSFGLKLDFLARSRSSFLEKYENYVDAVVYHVKVPAEATFVAFQFQAEEVSEYSLFGCSPRNISLYLKHGAPPVISPDNSLFPDSFKNISRPTMYNLEFRSDKTKKFINITSPRAGVYFVATFLKYEDPRFNSIKQQGLTPQCKPFIETTVLVESQNPIKIVTENQINTISAVPNQKRYIKIFISDYYSHAFVQIFNMSFTANSDMLQVRIQPRTVSENLETTTGKTEIFYPNTTAADLVFWTQESCWYFVEIEFKSATSTQEVNSLKIQIKLISNELNSTKHSTWKQFGGQKLTQLTSFEEFELVKDYSSESFAYTAELSSELNASAPLSINLTNTHFVALKFYLDKMTDIGGTLQYILAFKPRIFKGILHMEPENHTVVACIRKDTIEVPVWPHNCLFLDQQKEAPIFLNNTVDNSSILIPFPEGGQWYATFKLFCGTCIPCQCTHQCQSAYERCILDCEIRGLTNCLVRCRGKVLELPQCSSCDCDGPCRTSNLTCNSSVLFDVSSQACVGGHCGKHGRCMFLLANGFAYSSCSCLNHYRGWACSDDSHTTPFYLIVLELLLLVLSNLMFLPSTFLACKRKYFIEGLTYFSICFFSTFYHACDAGENRISFCITNLSALQFADFFCALLSIWVTLVAMADLPKFWPSLFQILGSIVLSFCTNIDKTSLWIFTLPSLSGLVLIGASWYWKYRKIKTRFVKKSYLCVYLPCGCVLVAVGLCIYTLLQTENNYKYLHSLWHIIMAVAVVVILPQRDTFQTETLL